MTNNIVEVRDMTVEFRKPRGALLAVNHVDFDVREGCVTALVGESGSGKSTLAFTMLNIVNTTGRILSGEVLYGGRNILELSTEELNAYKWKEVSMIFQSAQSALNPLMTIQEHFWETYHVHEPHAKEEDVIPRFRQLLEDVRLDPDRVLKLYPHELSGGMKQRVMIAFAMLLEPKFLILDEPTTALDVITQDYIFSILDRIHQETGVSMLLLTHDIGVVAKVADRIAVMYAGRIVEMGDIFEVFRSTAHPYAHALITTAPSLLDRDEDKEPIPGTPPDLIDLPAGCAFHPRCPYATELCRREVPVLRTVGEDHQAACHHMETFRKEAGIHG
ncbi:MAG: ABC transporter ATP-binding protein [Firmicutes bacterium]|nr:ABC transporter ATP-binding protein [Bacillota bacterium]